MFLNKQVYQKTNKQLKTKIMKTIRISKTIFPKDKPKDFNEWSMYFFGMYATELAKVKQGWDKNIYTPKNK